MDIFSQIILGIENFFKGLFNVSDDTIVNAEKTFVEYGSMFTDSSYQQITSPPLTGSATGVSKDVDVLARTMWGEARGEGDAGMQAVCNVIMNRVDDGRFGDGIQGVCLKPKQFSSWNTNDPNRARLISVTAADPAFARALVIAQAAVKRQLVDLTNGALYYYATSIDTPSWAVNLPVVASIGQHVFLEDA